MADQVRRAVEQLLDREVTAPPTPNVRAWGNESWIVETGGGRVLLKVGAEGIAGKWAASSVAHALALEAGVPAPRILAFVERCRLLEDRTVRIQEWLPGADPRAFLTTPAGIARFFRSLGRAVGRLHRVPLAGFSSRIDGSAPTFDRWGEYVAHRVPGIAERSRRAGLLSKGWVVDALQRAVRLADEVSPLVRPALAHRDLYLENVLAGPDGLLCGIIDFDLAEAWDPAVDLVKPRWQVFPEFPGAETAFHEGYADESAPLPRVVDRLRVADVLELTNAAASALLGDRSDYAEANLGNLRRVLAAWP